MYVELYLRFHMYKYLNGVYGNASLRHASEVWLTHAVRSKSQDDGHSGCMRPYICVGLRHSVSGLPKYLALIRLFSYLQAITCVFSTLLLPAALISPLIFPIYSTQRDVWCSLSSWWTLL